MVRNKITAVFAAAFIFSLIFSGCANKKNSEIVGKWTPSTATINGSSMKYSELGLEDSYFEFFFDENGSCRATLAGIESKGTYVFNDTSVDVTINKETKKLSYENGVLTLTFNYDNNDTSFSFVKESKAQE